MSVLVSREVWKHARASGNDLAVLLCLAMHVNDEKAKRGEPWHAWPSQSTIAAECNCSLATVKRSLARLLERGEIAAIGTKAGARGVKVFDVLPLDVAQNDPAQSEPGQIEPGEGEAGDDLAHSTDDLAQTGDDLAHFGASPSSPLSHKPVEPETPEPEGLEPENARAGARDPIAGSGLSPSASGSVRTAAQEAAERRDDEAELERLEEQLATTRHPEATERAIADLRERLDRIGVAA